MTVMTCRRIYPRLKIGSPVIYTQCRPGGDVSGWATATVCDISRGGAMIQVREPMEAGMVRLSIAVEGENDHVIMARVIYSRAAGSGRFHCGLKFLADDRKRRLAAAALVRSHCRRNHCPDAAHASQTASARGPIDTR